LANLWISEFALAMFRKTGDKCRIETHLANLAAHKKPSAPLGADNHSEEVAHLIQAGLAKVLARFVKCFRRADGSGSTQGTVQDANNLVRFVDGFSVEMIRVCHQLHLFPGRMGNRSEDANGEDSTNYLVRLQGFVNAESALCANVH
jgi:hypothetical protein